MELPVSQLRNLHQSAANRLDLETENCPGFANMREEKEEAKTHPGPRIPSEIQEEYKGNNKIVIFGTKLGATKMGTQLETFKRALGTLNF